MHTSEMTIVSSLGRGSLGDLFRMICCLRHQMMGLSLLSPVIERQKEEMKREKDILCGGELW